MSKYGDCVYFPFTRLIVTQVTKLRYRRKSYYIVTQAFNIVNRQQAFNIVNCKQAFKLSHISLHFSKSLVLPFEVSASLNGCKDKDCRKTFKTVDDGRLNSRTALPKGLLGPLPEGLSNISYKWYTRATTSSAFQHISRVTKLSIPHRKVLWCVGELFLKRLQN